MAAGELGTIATDLPARLGRLPRARFPVGVGVGIRAVEILLGVKAEGQAKTPRATTPGPRPER